MHCRMKFQSLIEQKDLPADYVGFVVSKPLSCLPVVNARTVLSTVELHLSRRGIEVLHGFESFPNLEVLWLNDNNLTALEGLDSNFRIKRLYVAQNRLTSLRGSLVCFKHLHELDVSSNLISDLEKCLETLELFALLKKLSMRGNPVAQEVGYRLRVIAHVPSLEILDHCPVTPEERVEAMSKFGSIAKSGMAVRSAHTQKSMVAGTNGSGPVFKYDVPLYSPMRRVVGSEKDPVGGLGASGIPVGFGRDTTTFINNGTLAGSAIQFGCEPGTTTLQKGFTREVAAIKSKRLAEQLAHTQQEFTASRSRADWGGSSMSGGGGFGDHNASLQQSIDGGGGQRYVTSALINITHPIFTEDVVTKKVRESMTQRGVEPELLTEASPYLPHNHAKLSDARLTASQANAPRSSTAASTSSARAQTHSRRGKVLPIDARAQMLGALAPIVPVSRASHPITDPTFLASDSLSTADTGDDNHDDSLPGAGLDGSASASSLLSASLRGNTARLGGLSASLPSGALLSSSGRGQDLFRTSMTHLPPQLAQTLAATGVKAVSEAQLAKMVLSRTGMRLKVQRSKAETLARYGLTPDGPAPTADGPRRLPGAQSHSSTLNSIMARTRPGTNGMDARNVPVLPQVSNSGKIGEWDKYKLRRIFAESDADGSGELSRDEIKGCLSSCADYGFCVMTGDDDNAASSSTALLGTSLANATGTQSHSRLNSMLDAIFDAIDADKSGTVTWAEFMNVLETGIVAPKDTKKAQQNASSAVPAGPAAADGKPPLLKRVPSMQTAATAAGGSATPASAGSASPRPGSRGKAAGRPLSAGSAGVGSEASARPGSGGGGAAAAAQAMLTMMKSSKASAAANAKAEPVRVPQLRFRSLTAQEAKARSERYFRQAAEAWRRYQTVPADAWDRDKQLQTYTSEMTATAEKGNRLAYIAQALGGDLDPPEPQPSPPRARSDWVDFTSLVPAREEAKRYLRGNRNYRAAYPGDESDEDEEKTRKVLHPDPISLAEEEEDPARRRDRLAKQALLLRTLGDDKWERYRLQTKAKAPHVVHRTTVHI